ncbi:MAG TPA: hypothetical protein P5080_00370 [Candidatus Paceibacterota bacterium]|nr:hypothetical protein [Candidatus Pacearchaeota archaeon]HRZ50429.1 hypothetical protein [Candidatus Paceibacterota bacterium]HSA36150.1 hypothetical protein [Candidatus Paceibacterota bacterium]
MVEIFAIGWGFANTEYEEEMIEEIGKCLDRLPGNAKKGCNITFWPSARRYALGEDGKKKPFLLVFDTDFKLSFAIAKVLRDRFGCDAAVGALSALLTEESEEIVMTGGAAKDCLGTFFPLADKDGDIEELMARHDDCGGGTATIGLSGRLNDISREMHINCQRCGFQIVFMTSYRDRQALMKLVSEGKEGVVVFSFQNGEESIKFIVKQNPG